MTCGTAGTWLLAPRAPRRCRSAQCRCRHRCRGPPRCAAGLRRGPPCPGLVPSASPRITSAQRCLGPNPQLRPACCHEPVSADHCEVRADAARALFRGKPRHARRHESLRWHRLARPQLPHQGTHGPAPCSWTFLAHRAFSNVAEVLPCRCARVESTQYPDVVGLEVGHPGSTSMRAPPTRAPTRPASSRLNACVPVGVQSPETKS